MKLEHGFTVAVPVADAWRVLLDLPTVAPCMPGAKLDSYSGDDFTGTVKVKLGPINLTYKGQGRIAKRDEANHRAVIEASGKESRGAGTAKATVTATLHPDGDAATKVDVVTDLNITGRPAQFGRGMMVDVGNKLIGQFADCLSRKLTAGEVTASPATSVGTTAAAAQPDTTGAGVGSAREPGASPTAAQTGAEPAKPVAEPTAPVAQPVAASRSAVDTRSDEEVEPIDLLQVTGAGSIVRKAATYTLVFALGLLIGWLLTRRGG